MFPSLHRVQPAREGLGAVEDAVAVGVGQQFDRVAGGVWLRVAVLRALTDEETAARIERDRARVADQWLAGHELHLDPGGSLGQQGGSGFGGAGGRRGQ